VHGFAVSHWEHLRKDDVTILGSDSYILLQFGIQGALMGSAEALRATAGGGLKPPKTFKETRKKVFRFPGGSTL